MPRPTLLREAQLDPNPGRDRGWCAFNAAAETAPQRMQAGACGQPPAHVTACLGAAARTCAVLSPRRGRRRRLFSPLSQAATCDPPSGARQGYVRLARRLAGTALPSISFSSGLVGLGVTLLAGRSPWWSSGNDSGVVTPPGLRFFQRGFACIASPPVRSPSGPSAYVRCLLPQPACLFLCNLLRLRPSPACGSVDSVSNLGGIVAYRVGLLCCVVFITNERRGTEAWR